MPKNVWTQEKLEHRVLSDALAELEADPEEFGTPRQVEDVLVSVIDGLVDNALYLDSPEQLGALVRLVADDALSDFLIARISDMIDTPALADVIHGDYLDRVYEAE